MSNSPVWCKFEWKKKKNSSADWIKVTDVKNQWRWFWNEQYCAYKMNSKTAQTIHAFKWRSSKRLQKDGLRWQLGDSTNSTNLFLPLRRHMLKSWLFCHGMHSTRAYYQTLHRLWNVWNPSIPCFSCSSIYMHVKLIHIWTDASVCLKYPIHLSSSPVEQKQMYSARAHVFGVRIVIVSLLSD